MTVSWLTASDNLGHFLMSLNRGRHTAAHMAVPGSLFVLAVPTAAMRATVLRVGACSGRDVDKLEHLALPVQPVGEQFGVDGCVAFLVCRVNTLLGPAAPIADAACERAFQSTTNHHLLLHCTAMRGLVAPTHWDGRRFAARGDASPHLSFLGSQVFAAVVALPDDDNSEPAAESSSSTSIV